MPIKIVDYVSGSKLSTLRPRSDCEWYRFWSAAVTDARKPAEFVWRRTYRVGLYDHRASCRIPCKNRRKGAFRVMLPRRNLGPSPS